MFLYFFRHINLSAIQKAVENLTSATRWSNRKQTPTAAAGSSDTTPLSANPEIVPDTKDTTTNKSGASDVTPAVTDKELSVTISSFDVQWCKPQTARRGKKMLGPNCQDDRKTLAEMKKKTECTRKQFRSKEHY